MKQRGTFPRLVVPAAPEATTTPRRRRAGGGAGAPPPGTVVAPPPAAGGPDSEVMARVAQVVGEAVGVVVGGAIKPHTDALLTVNEGLIELMNLNRELRRRIEALEDRLVSVEAGVGKLRGRSLRAVD